MGQRRKPSPSKTGRKVVEEFGQSARNVNFNRFGLADYTGLYDFFAFTEGSGHAGGEEGGFLTTRTGTNLGMSGQVELTGLSGGVETVVGAAAVNLTLEAPYFPTATTFTAKFKFSGDPPRVFTRYIDSPTLRSQVFTPSSGGSESMNVRTSFDPALADINFEFAPILTNGSYLTFEAAAPDGGPIDTTIPYFKMGATVFPADVVSVGDTIQFG